MAEQQGHLLRRAALAAALSAAALTATSLPATASSTNSALAAARAATAAFHDPAAAQAAGYLRTEDCVAVPGLGVMGQHWINPRYFGSVDPAHPQALLYVPTNDGPRLVAVEYIVPTNEPVAANPGQVDPNGPELFGQHLNGVLAGHVRNTPNHWDLHVWIWAHNPAGVFSQFNPAPALSC
ncbi:MAG: hypothetical protein ACR2K2_08380 [Mycobacteriales bacterium]